MDVDLSRLPAGTSGWLALVDHALALGDLSEVDYLELKGALSFAGPDRKRSAVVLSRAILGMANRMPDLAAKHLGGSGVVLIGIDQSQKLVGVEPVDAAVLRDVIQPYVGENGPSWDHQFITHPDGLVLAVIVDPPQWGDRIHACRKDYQSDDGSKLSVRDGEVFVRLPGKTRPATSHDLEQLERRRARAPHTGAQVSVAYVGAFDRTSCANVRELIEGMVDEVADELIDGLPEPAPLNPYSEGIQRILEQNAGRVDRRNPERFRADVKQWQEDCREAADDVVREFLRHTLEHGTFMIRNESDRYLENVRVEVQFPSDVTVLMASDTDYCDHGGQFQIFQMLPDRPAKYGDLRPYGFDYGSVRPAIKPVVATNIAVPDMDVETTPDGHIVAWFVGDLPPRASVTATEEFAVFTDEDLNLHNHEATEECHVPMPSEIDGSWRVTARGVDHVFEGAFTVACRQEPGGFAIWRRATPA